MSCYIRHLPDFMEFLGLEDTSENRKKLDLAIRGQIGMSKSDHCPEVWAKLKPIIADSDQKADLLDDLAKLALDF